MQCLLRIGFLWALMLAGCTQLEYTDPTGGTFYYWSSRDTSLQGDVKVDPSTGVFQWEGMNVSGQASPVVQANWTGFNEALATGMGMAAQIYQINREMPVDEEDDSAFWERVDRLIERAFERRFPITPPEPEPDPEG